MSQLLESEKSQRKFRHCLPVREEIEKEQDAAIVGSVTMTLPHTTIPHHPSPQAFSHLNKALTSDSSSVTTLREHVFSTQKVTGAEGGGGKRAREQR